MSTNTLVEIELLADSDGTFGARWSGDEHCGATWDHTSLDSVLTEIHYAIDPPWAVPKKGER